MPLNSPSALYCKLEQVCKWAEQDGQRAVGKLQALLQAQAVEAQEAVVTDAVAAQAAQAAAEAVAAEAVAAEAAAAEAAKNAWDFEVALLVMELGAFGLLSSWRKRKFHRLAERDGPGCFHCKTLFELTLDHKVPKAAGGTYDDQNLRLACLACNQRAGFNFDQNFVRKGKPEQCTACPRRFELWALVCCQGGWMHRGPQTAILKDDENESPTVPLARQ